MSTSRADTLIDNEAVDLNKHVLQCDMCLNTARVSDYEPMVEVSLCNKAMGIRKYYDTLIILCDVDVPLIDEGDILYSIGERTDADFYPKIRERVMTTK